MTLPETATFKEFAGIAKFRPSYISQLKADGRLVLTEDGKRVRVAESLQRIADTKDPSKAGVAARHAADRVEPDGDGADAMISERVPTQAETAANDRIGSSYQASRAVKERYLALDAKRSYEVNMGRLLDADQVAAAAARASSAFRMRMESLPAVIAPQLVAAANDEHRMQLILAHEIEHALGELYRQFSKLARKEAA